MDNPKAKKSVSLARCQFCGSTWFREADVNRYLPQTEEHFSKTTYWMVRGEVLNCLLPRIRVCLCGATLRPHIGGMLIPGRRLLEETISFNESLDGALNDTESSGASVEEFRKQLEEAVAKDLLSSAAARMRRLEEYLLNEQKKADPKLLAGVRKPWKRIDRKPEAAQGRDQLVLALQHEGYTYRMARLLIKVIFESCSRVLRQDGLLATPIGEFRVEEAPQERQHMAFGRRVKTYRKSYWIRFRPAPDLAIRADAGGYKADAGGYEEDVEEETDQMRRRRTEDRPAKCPRCGSQWLMEAEFRRYIDAYGYTPGADFFPADDLSFPLRVCLCGEPLGALLTRERAHNIPGLPELQKSAGKAKRYRERHGQVEDAMAELQSQGDEQARILLRLSNLEAAFKTTLGIQPAEAS